MNDQWVVSILLHNPHAHTHLREWMNDHGCTRYVMLLEPCTHGFNKALRTKRGQNEPYVLDSGHEAYSRSQPIPEEQSAAVEAS